MLYIQKNIQFLELEQELPDSYLVGDNIENYEDGAYLLKNRNSIITTIRRHHRSSVGIWH